jgi:SAM-dependent methyltransferase
MKQKGVPMAPLIYQPKWRPDTPWLIDVERDSTPARADLLWTKIDPTGHHILDLGCNNGYFLFEAAKRGARVCWGVDYHQPAIDAASQVRHQFTPTHPYVDRVNLKCFDLTDLHRVRDILSRARPTIILLFSIFHHLPDDIARRLVDYCLMAAKHVIIEYPNEKEHWRELVKGQAECQIEEEFVFDAYYNNLTNPDHQGYKRPIYHYWDPQCDAKWVHYHDNRVLNTFWQKRDRVTKHFYEGRRPELLEATLLHHATPLFLVKGPIPHLREQLIDLLNQLGSEKKVHCELYKNILYEDGKIWPSDWETEFYMSDSVERFYNDVVRTNRVFGKVDETDKTLITYPNRGLIERLDIKHVSALLHHFGLPALSSIEVAAYYKRLRG